MTTEEFRRLNERQAEHWFAERFRRLLDSGLPPDLALIFAGQLYLEVPQHAPAKRRTGAAKRIRPELFRGPTAA